MRPHLFLIDIPSLLYTTFVADVAMVVGNLLDQTTDSLEYSKQISSALYTIHLLLMRK